MKTLILSFLFITASLAGYSTSIVVDNSSGSGAPYTSLQLALDDAVAGDTIYVSPSGTTYGDITIRRQVVMIGSGRRPGAQVPGESVVGRISFEPTLPSGSYFSGLRVTSYVYLYQATSVSNVTFERNIFSQAVYLNSNNPDCKFIGNIFTNVVYNDLNSGAAANTIFQNNFFYREVRGLNSTSLAFNNITLDEFWGASATIFNNIFMSNTTTNSVNLTDNCTNCTYNNNLTWAPNTTGFVALVDGLNSFGGNNLDNTDPLFVNVPVSTLGGFTYGNDYRLQDLSPGNNYGTDGTDLGLYGGNYNFVNNYNPDDVPRMLFMNVTNAVIQQGGTLNVEVRAVSQN
ncbi:MAG: hypothetical protein ACNS60_12500 [Candidatus Cyclobacteriaceae bacterium M2_1C_046]